MWLAVTVGHNTYLMPWIFPCLFRLKWGHPIFSPRLVQQSTNGEDGGEKQGFTLLFSLVFQYKHKL